MLPPASPPAVFSFQPPQWAAAPPEEVKAEATHDALCESDGQKKVYGEGVNELIHGSFVVVNTTNGPITDVMITHECDENKEIYSPARMEKDEVSLLTKLTGATWHEDLWSISFKDVTLQTKSLYNKRCDYERSDAPQTFIVILYNNNFSIVIPASAGYFFNHY